MSIVIQDIDLRLLNTDSIEGELLIVALAKLTCTIYADKTPHEVLKILAKEANEMTRLTNGYLIT